MTTHARRIPILLSALCLLCLLASTSLFAQITKNDFSDTSDLVLNGSAAGATNGQQQQVLRLSPDGTQHVSGTGWFHTKQSVAGGFTSTFQFQVTHAGTPADGIAFIIQNSNTAARGGSGGAIGYGFPDGGPDSDNGGVAISNALAIELDTFQNGWDPNANHIAVQSCGPDPVTQHHDANCPNGQPSELGIASDLPANLSDGNVHTIVVDYDPGTLRIFLDNFGTPILTVSVDLSTLLTLDEGGNAIVGFSGSSGSNSENNDILSWVFTPGDAATTVTQDLTAGTGQQTTNYVFGSYNHKLQYTNSEGDSLSITATPIDQATFHQTRLNGTPFSGADCVIYDGTGGKCVVFSANCSEGSDCQNLVYDLFNSFNTSQTITGAGLLKTDPIGSNNWANIIQTFTQTRTDPTTHGGSKGFSDFVVVQNATGAPTFTNVSPANNSFVPVNTSVTISFTCTPDPTAPNVTLLPQDQGCSGKLDGNPVTSGTMTSFSQVGPHALVLAAADSVMNTSSGTVNFNVGQSPAFTSANSTTFTAGVFGSFTVVATGSPTPAISQTGMPGFLTLTDNGNGTATLSGTPPSNSGGNYPFTLKATNALGAPTQGFTLTVNQAPAFTSANSTTFSVGVAGSFTVTTTGFPTASLSYSGALPSGVTFVDNGNGTGKLSGTPTVTGSFPLVFTATNAAGAPTQNFSLNVSGPQAIVSPSSINFGNVVLYTLLFKNVTVTNTGTSALKINKVSITLGHADIDDYFFLNLCPSSLPAGKSCLITVFFWADDLGTRTATLNVFDNAGQQNVSLTGNVIKKK